MEREAIEVRLRDLSALDVARVAAAALRTDHTALSVTDWRWEPLKASLGIATAGLYRISGRATVSKDVGRGNLQDPTRPQLEQMEWSAILKVIRPPTGTRHAAYAREPSHWAFWKREPLFYTSALATTLTAHAGGLLPPRCLHVDERGSAGQADESAWLWLEEVDDAHGGWWSAERTLLAARHVGAFGGTFLNRPPTHAWLARGALRQRIERSASELPLFQDDALWQHPLLRPHFQTSVGARLRDIWTRRWELVDRLDALPRTLCHGDCHRGNLFAIEQRDRGASHGTAPPGPPRTAAIDWGAAGIGPIGADLAELALSRAIAGELLAPDGAGFGEHLFASYVDGLRDVTSPTNADITAAREGYALTAALAGASRLHWTLQRTLADPTHPAPDATQPPHPEPEDLLRRWAALTRMFLALQD